jgi:hypothetical protein
LTETPRVTVEPGSWAVARLAPGSPVPRWASSDVFSSITRTGEELSIVCPESAVPEGVRVERGWTMLKLAGPFPFTATGVLESVLAPLAVAKISVFAVSTFDTDYVLVPKSALSLAIDAIEAARIGPVTP